MPFSARVVSESHASDIDRPVGVLAGWGRLPFAVAEALRQQGRRVVGIGILDHADPRLADLCEEFGWIGIGGIGRAIKYCKQWGVTEVTMTGKLHKVLLYQPGWWLRHRPDWKTIKAFYPHLLMGKRDRKDDTLLGTVADAFASEGIRCEPATNFAPELLVKAGPIAGKRLTGKQQRDVEFGWQIAKEMGGLDIGQSVCIKNQTVLTVEAIEGTDLSIQRAGELCKSGGFTVVKVAKPQQDMRFDVPTVGTKTLESIAAAGGKVLAIEADQTILLDRVEFCQAAERLKLSVVALSNSAIAKAAA